MTDVRHRKRDGVVSRNLGEECILYDETRGGMHVVNPVAGFVFGLCDGRNTPAEMEARVREAFAVPEGSDLRGDVERILQKLVDLGIVVLAEGC
jgi:hypothetical protein